MRVTYRDRLDNDRVICLVRWTDPGTMSVLAMEVRVAADLDEVPVPEPIKGHATLSTDVLLPLRVKLLAVEEAQTACMKFAALQMSNG